MKIEFLKEYKFYLPGNTRKMWVMKPGSKFEHDNEPLLQKWIDRGFAKLDEPVKVESPEPVIEVAMEDVQEKKETKPLPRKRRSRKAK